jgi:formimidoylglutamate deiminase
MPPRAYLPDLLLAAGQARAGAALVVAEGRVTAVGAAPPGADLVRLPGAAVLPALASAHSHAFQRALRGKTQLRAAGRATFWSWREAMYAVAARIGPDDLEAVAALLFLELARAGVAAVGEFHYLHRDPAGAPYADPDELAKRTVAAARAVGLRVVLLRAAYARAGAGDPPAGAQRRFADASPDDAALAVERLARAHAADPLVSFGLAPHSVRACPAEWIRALAAEAARRRLPLHLHAAEQPRELEACRAEHGATPVRLLERLGALGPRTTLVHAIHVDGEEIAAIARSGAGVCACPTTERDLGDGVVPADRLLAAGVPLALGTDSNVEVDLFAEARALEGHLRLVSGERAVLGREGEGADALALRLLDVAARGGRAALGLEGGHLAPGDPADFQVLDLADPSLVGAAEGDLATHAVFSLSRTAVRDLYVAGEPVVLGGRAARVDERAVAARGAAALARLVRDG